MSKNEPKIHTIKPYTKDAIDLCLDDIKTGRLSCYAASKRFGIPISTLRYRLSGRWKHSVTPGPPSILAPAEEQEIVDWLLDMQSRGFCMTRAECLSKVSNYLTAVGRQTAFKNSCPGRKWFDLFLRRNPSFIPSKTSSATSAESIRSWFHNVKSWLMRNNQFEILKDPTRVYILEEITLSFTLTSSGQPEINSPVVIFSFGASGTIVHPSIIVTAERASQNSELHNLPAGWGMELSEHSNMSTQIFRNYVSNIFHPFLVKQGVKFPVVLFVDGHALSQVSDVEELCQSLGIILISPYRVLDTKMAPKSAGIDMAKTLQLEWLISVKKWSTENPGKVHTWQEFSSILHRTMQQDIIKRVIHSGFWSSGLHPFNVEAVDYSEFPMEMPEIITQLEEPVSNELFDTSFHPFDTPLLPFDTPLLPEPDAEEAEPQCSNVNISIDKIYEAYDLIDDSTRLKIQGDIRDLTREERIIRFFYREFIQPNVYFNDEHLKDSDSTSIKEEHNIDDVIKSEISDHYPGSKEGESTSLSSYSDGGAFEGFKQNETIADSNYEQQEHKNSRPHFGQPSMFCRMCGIQQQSNQKYNLRELESNSKIGALMQICFEDYDGVNSTDSLCPSCYREINNFQGFLQKSHEKQRNLFARPTNSQINENNIKQPVNASRSQTWQCHRCDKNYKAKFDLHQHIVRDHGEISYTCDVCGAVLKSKTTLYQHRRLRHTVYLKKCNYCSKRFSTDKMFEKHLQIHYSADMGTSAEQSSHFGARTNQFETGEEDAYETILGDVSVTLDPDTIKAEPNEFD